MHPNQYFSLFLGDERPFQCYFGKTPGYQVLIHSHSNITLHHINLLIGGDKVRVAKVPLFCRCSKRASPAKEAELQVWSHKSGTESRHIET
jgi:hypothetical protein